MIYWILSSLLCGLILFLIFLLIFYWYYIKEAPKKTQIPFKPQFEDYFITKSLTDLISNDKNGCVAGLNVLLQFLFQELKDSGSVRRYIIRKMTIEFKELLTTKQIGIFIEKITARDFSLGTGCPIIHSFSLESFKTDSTKTKIQEFGLLVDIEYKDGFSISVDVDLILGRSAYVHIKVVSLKGKARLEFKREPFTHWYFQFVNEPEIEFSAASQFESKQIPQLTSLIINQLRRSVRKKHTYPNFKIRYKPFFDQLIQSTLAANLMKNSKNKTPPPDNCKYSNGKLNITIEKFDHVSDSLLLRYPDASFYLTVSLDPYSFNSFISLETHKNNWPIHDIELTRSVPTEQLGITFAETMFLNQNEVAVHKITPNSLASNSIVPIQIFDILVSINGTKVTSVKQAYKIIQKSLITIKFQFQRPIIKFKIEKQSSSKIPHSNSIASNLDIFVTDTDPVTKQQTVEDVHVDNKDNSPIKELTVDVTASQASPSKHSPNITQQASISPSIKTQSSNSSLNTTPHHPTIQLVQNTSQRIQQKLSSFRRSNQAANTSATTANNEQLLSAPSTPQAPSNVTHLASANALLDFYCAIAENGPEPGNANDIDLMFLASNESISQEDVEKRQLYYKRSKNMKIENSSMSCINMNETFSFGLNENTIYLNVCIWAAIMNKSKPRNILVGYVNIPVNDINSDCWLTMKGESKQTCHFKPIETKASAQSRPHVLSSHPGFDSSLTFGAITISFQHSMKNKEQDSTSQQTVENEKIVKETVHGVVENLFKEAEVEKDLESNKEVDKYTHKFVSTQSNEACGLCKKKIWLKNALKCAFCDFVIHNKCYEKAIQNTICSRYSTDSDPSSKSPGLIKKSRSTKSLTVDQSVVINDEDYCDIDKKSLPQFTKSLGNFTGSMLSLAQKQVETNSQENPKAKNYVSNLFNGLRQRKWNLRRTRTSSQNLIVEKDSTEDTVIISSLRSKINDSTEPPNDNNNNNNSIEAIEIFQDAEVDFLCEDKHMGRELFDELPPHERKLKLEEISFKFHSTLEMMKNLKKDLECDLKSKEALGNNEKLQEQLKYQIEQLKDQMKSVVFLLMRYQEGIDYCQELIARDKNT